MERRLVGAMTTPGTHPMRLLSAALILTLSAVACAAHAASAPAPVEIASGNLRLHAQLFKPDGNGPFPAVIALHGCGGLSAGNDAVAPHYRDWADELVKAGYAVLLPDSFGSREVGPQCREKERKVLARRERVADVTAAHKWLIAQNWAARDRVSLIGWAHGASTVLWAVRPQLAIRGREPDYRSAIAFYPQCRTSSRTGWSARVPTLLLIGGNDDIAAPSLCKQMVDGARGRTALTRITVYPDALHDFDRADLPPRALDGHDPTLPEHGHIGGDAEARSDAQKRVAEWLAR
jgi:dienelactone hydrolase